MHLFSSTLAGLTLSSFASGTVCADAAASPIADPLMDKTAPEATLQN